MRVIDSDYAWINNIDGELYCQDISDGVNGFRLLSRRFVSQSTAGVSTNFPSTGMAEES